MTAELISPLKIKIVNFYHKKDPDKVEMFSYLYKDICYQSKF